MVRISINKSHAQALRLAGFFLLFVALLSSVNWLLIIREDYVMEHEWPAAIGTVYSMREESREVIPASSRSHHYWVYWAEFVVILDLPADKCPGQMQPLDGHQPQCFGTVKTPEVRSRQDAVEWFSRHSRNSRVVVHYDPQSASMVFGGESIFHIYPWRMILLTIALLALSTIMVVVGRSVAASVPDNRQPLASVDEFLV
jgi:hypothetical protein